jgi:hypothetical protein
MLLTLPVPLAQFPFENLAVGVLGQLRNKLDRTWFLIEGVVAATG